MKARVSILLVMLTVMAPLMVVAKDLSGLYDAATLQRLQPRYEATSKKLLEHLIWDALLPQERQRFAGIRVEHPLEAEGKLKGEPLMFYAQYPRVVLPVFSLKFLEDLCTATAWLQVHDYSLETVSDYVAMLRFRDAQDFPNKRYPPPLSALRIPDNALQDTRVDELALNHFVTARAFLLLHELGHLYYRHNPTTLAVSQRNEREADRFAAEVLQRTPVPPLGSLVFFMALAHWADYPPQDLHTHPLSGERLHALARHIDNPELARGIEALATQLDDPEIWTSIAAAVRATDPTTLAPRRTRELPRFGHRDSQGEVAFAGTYMGTVQQHSHPEPMPIIVVLTRQGARVEGQYSFGLGLGKIEGTVHGDMLHFEWSWAGDFGRGALKTPANGQSFAGTWGYRASADNAGTWNGRREE
jgi:Peptidase U49